MLTNIFPKTIIDNNFGAMKITRDKAEDTYNLIKTIDFGPFNKIDLYLENKLPKSTAEQLKLFNLINDNATKIIEACKDKYFESYQNDLFAIYGPEFILFNDKDTIWELWLTEIGGFSCCVVEFDKLEVQNLSFQA